MKDKFSIFIEDSVYLLTKDYLQKMLDTKMAFFNMLNEEISYDKFKQVSASIWADIDHEFIKQRIEELEKMIDNQNIGDKTLRNSDAEYVELYEMVKVGRFTEVELRFKELIDKYYYDKLKTIKQELVDKEDYLANSIYDYDKLEQTIPYYNQDGHVVAYHTPATYLSMLYNVNLTRAAWNRTFYDSELLDNPLVYLIAHTYSCPRCIDSQGKVYSTNGTYGTINGITYEPKENAIERGVGHPNCRHVFVIYWSDEQLQKNVYNSESWNEKYIIKQKIKALDLKRRKLEVNRDIADKLNNNKLKNKEQAKLDRVNKEIIKLNNEL